MAKKIRVWDGTQWVQVAVQNELPANVATVTYVDATVNSAVNNLVDAAPTALNTLNELAAALNDDANFATTVTNQIAAKASTGKAIAMAMVFGG